MNELNYKPVNSNSKKTVSRFQELLKFLLRVSNWLNDAQPRKVIIYFNDISLVLKSSMNRVGMQAVTRLPGRDKFFFEMLPR